jgi:hypothetical protein
MEIVLPTVKSDGYGCCFAETTGCKSGSGLNYKLLGSIC